MHITLPVCFYLTLSLSQSSYQSKYFSCKQKQSSYTKSQARADDSNTANKKTVLCLELYVDDKSKTRIKIMCDAADNGRYTN